MLLTTGLFRLTSVTAIPHVSVVVLSSVIYCKVEPNMSARELKVIGEELK